MTFQFYSGKVLCMENPPSQEFNKNNQTLDAELELLFNNDQADRTNKLRLENEELYLEREKMREVRALEIYQSFREGTIELSPLAILHLAWIFHHRGSSEDYKTAFELAKEASEQGEDQALWLQAATEDRYLISLGKNQKWGTQFKKDENGEWKYLTPVEEGEVTDEERKEMNVPVLADQLATIKEKYANK
jgi:hypothetical protein